MKGISLLQPASLSYYLTMYSIQISHRAIMCQSVGQSSETLEKKLLDEYKIVLSLTIAKREVT